MADNNLPEHWQIKKLGEICTISYGKGLPVKQLKPYGYPVFGANGIIGFNDKYLFEEPQVLISCRGAASGKINLSPAKCYVTNNSLVLSIIKKRDIDRSFLFYALTIAKKNKLVTGTAQPQVTINNAIELDIPIPPFPEQKMIVSKIEELLSDLENGKLQLLTSLEQLKIYRQSLLNCAFKGKLTNSNVNDMLPKEWRWIKLGDVCSGVEYGSATKSKKIGKVPVLRMGNIQNGKFNWDDLVFTDDNAEIEKYLLKKDDVLFNRTNSADLVGKTATYKGERKAIFAGYLIRINRIDSLIDASYLTYFLNTHFAKSYGNSVRSFGVNQSNINGTKLKTYPIPLCSLTEQRLIVEELENKLTVCDKIEETINLSLQQSETLRQSILKKAFNGTLLNL